MNIVQAATKKGIKEKVFRKIELEKYYDPSAAGPEEALQDTDDAASEPDDAR